MVTRTCGSANNWQGIAAADGIAGPDYVITLGVAYTINCSLPADPAPPPPAPAPPAPAPVSHVQASTSAPVAGLNSVQTGNARIIIQVAKNMGLPKQAMVIALCTALQESSLLNLANPWYPESYNYTNQGEGYDHDSLGLFQQRPSSGWGSVSQIMDPWYAAGIFYTHLEYFDWYDYSIAGAAQKVQVSAYPDAYAKWEGLAWSVVDAVA